MREITLAETARAIRPFLPTLAGPDATGLDLRLTELLTAVDTGEDVDDQLGEVLELPPLANWTTHFLEHGQPLVSLAEGKLLVVQPSLPQLPLADSPLPAAAAQPSAPGHGYPLAGVPLSDSDVVYPWPGGGGQPPAPDLVYPRLDARAQVAPGDEFTVTAGLRADPDELLETDGPIDLPIGAEIQVALQADPDAFLVLSPSPVATLQRTPAEPWPSADFQLIARSSKDLRTERHLRVNFLRDGQLVGHAVREIWVSSTPDTATPGPPAGASFAVPADGLARDPAAEQLDLREFADDQVDLIISIQPSDDVSHSRLTFNAYSRHTDVKDQAVTLTQELRGEGSTGATPEQIGQQVRLKVSSTSDQEDLFWYLRGLGDHVFCSLPENIIDAVRAALAKGTAQAPARILLFSGEPHVPWELAVDPDGWQSTAGAAAPFLGAHAAISRWLPGKMPPPRFRPVPVIDVRDKALVTAHYNGVMGQWGVGLPSAEEEVERLETFLAPGALPVKAALHDVLKLLNGTPPADLMHFALHGNFDPLGINAGLVLLRDDGDPPKPQFLQEQHVRGHKLSREPFVYLNACQVATGSNAAFPGYGGLVGAFLRAGARGVLAPLWNVTDTVASAMATEFYELSVGEERLPAAEILRRFRARYTEQAITDREPNVDATLIGFQLFAHPGLRLFPQATDLTREQPHA
jgi:hypothetical protein